MYNYFNRLTGRIPTQLGLLFNLQYLVMEDNDLTGSVPEELQGMAEMKIDRNAGMGF